jgi:hypothetical protein
MGLTGRRPPGSTARGSPHVHRPRHGNRPSGGHQADRWTLGRPREGSNTPIVVLATVNGCALPPSKRLQREQLAEGCGAARCRLLPCLLGRQSSRKDRRPLAPLRGSGAAAPGGALRAIDSSARPRPWRTYGPRRLRRQSDPEALATQGSAPPPGKQCMPLSPEDAACARIGQSSPWTGAAWGVDDLDLVRRPRVGHFVQSSWSL